MTRKSEEPTPIQKKIVEFIEKCIRARGIPPSIKEIGSSVGLSSSSSVHNQLQNLERLGLIRRDPTKSRCIEIVRRSDAPPVSETAADEADVYHDYDHAPPQGSDGDEKTADRECTDGQSPEEAHQETAESHEHADQRAASQAGMDGAIREETDGIHRYPLFIYEGSHESEGGAEQSRNLKADTIPLPVDFIGTREAFLLEMDGDSMKEAGILEGDFCIIRQGNTPRDGDIVACKIEDEVTVKRFFNGPGYYILEPENHRYRRILVKDALFLGRVIGVLRNWERKTGISQDL